MTTLRFPERPSREEGLRLFQLLCAGEAAAPALLMRAFVPALMAWMDTHHGRAAPDLRQDAVYRALASLCQRPESFDPDQSDLFDYLTLSATGDLRNLLRQEGRHHRGRVSWNDVEDGRGGGNLPGEEDEPVAQLCRAEEDDERRRFLAQFRDGLDDEEKIVFDLMGQEVRQTAEFIRALGRQDLLAAEQERYVKRIKDRIKTRARRQEKNRERPT
jgi:hypothetical protein